ncbi:MAG: hypothetical protein CM1200mP2_06770 [Planctomycetaceae bacterium]|nr:MAG: hypothetical protein CM1200mP2_06770 [Planctomycetaceae bacterium]
MAWTYRARSSLRNDRSGIKRLGGASNGDGVTSTTSRACFCHDETSSPYALVNRPSPLRPARDSNWPNCAMTTVVPTRRNCSSRLPNPSGRQRSITVPSRNTVSASHARSRNFGRAAWKPRVSAASR